MVKKSVIWTETASRQRREILKYWTIRNGSTQYAEKLIQLIRQRIQVLTENEFAGKPTNHKETRVAAMGNFSIFYKITESQLIITSFWDNRQDPEKLFQIIKNKI
jgi:plasmid stabilization system protein ParE